MDDHATLGDSVIDRIAVEQRRFWTPPVTEGRHGTGKWAR
jgi:hypothetical protein